MAGCPSGDTRGLSAAVVRGVLGAGPLERERDGLQGWLGCWGRRVWLVDVVVGVGQVVLAVTEDQVGAPWLG